MRNNCLVSAFGMKEARVMILITKLFPNPVNWSSKSAAPSAPQGIRTGSEK